MARKILPEKSIGAKASQSITNFHSDVVAHVEKSINENQVVVVGMKVNPVVKKVRKALDEAKVKFVYIEYGSYLSQWKERLAIKMWSGWPTFPQVFAKGVLVGGADETIQSLKDGTLKV